MAINWAKNMNALNMAGGNKPKGDDWFSAKEFAEKSDYGTTKCYEILKKAIQDGAIEVYRGSEYNKSQKQLTRRVWYRFTNRN